MLQVGQEAESNCFLIGRSCHKQLTESRDICGRFGKPLIVWKAMAKDQAAQDAIHDYLARIGKKGGLAKVKKGTATLTKAERATRAKEAAAARWGKKRPS